MKTAVYFLSVLVASLLARIVQAQDSLRLEVFNQANTPVFTTNSFSSIEATPTGVIWAGTLGQGLYRYSLNTTFPTWTRSPNLAPNFIRDIRSDASGGIWLAQSGFTSGTTQNTNGGVNYITPDETGFQYFGALNGLRTRNARSVAVALNDYVYIANGLSLTAGVSNLGGYSYKAPTATTFIGRAPDLTISNEDGPCSAVASSPNTSTTWIAVDRSCRTNLGCVAPRILSVVNGNVVSTYGNMNGLPVTDQTGTPSIRALCLDALNRGWVGLSAGGVYYLPTGGTQFLSIPSGVLPASTAINPNSSAPRMACSS
jgi:hypothetical protein